MKGSEFMTKIKQIIYVSVFAMLFLTGCGADRLDTATAYDSVIKNEGWRIQEACSEITEEMAENIYQDVLKLKQDLRKGIYTVENSRIVFLQQCHVTVCTFSHIQVPALPASPEYMFQPLPFVHPSQAYPLPRTFPELADVIKESNEISESSEQPEETLEPFEQYAADHWKENVEEQRQIGRERILEAAGA